MFPLKSPKSLTALGDRTQDCALRLRGLSSLAFFLFSGSTLALVGQAASIRVSSDDECKAMVVHFHS
jgi:hypothetical protein